MFKKFLYQSTSICFFSLAFVGSSSLYTAKAMTPDEKEYQHIRERLKVNTFEEAKTLFERDGKNSPYLKKIATKLLKEFSKKEGDPDQYNALDFLLKNGTENDKTFSREHLLTNILSCDKDKKTKSAEVLFKDNPFPRGPHQSIGARTLATEGIKDFEGVKDWNLLFEAATHLKGWHAKNAFDGEDGEISRKIYHFFAKDEKNLAKDYENFAKGQHEAAQSLFDSDNEEDRNIALNALRRILGQPNNKGAFSAAKTLERSENLADKSLSFAFYKSFTSNPKNCDEYEWAYRDAANRLWDKYKKDQQISDKEAALAAYSHLIKEASKSNSLAHSDPQLADILYEDSRYKLIACEFYKSKLSFNEERFYHPLLRLDQYKEIALNKLRSLNAQSSNEIYFDYLIFAYGNNHDRATYREGLRRDAYDGRCTGRGPYSVWALSRSPEDLTFAKSSSYWGRWPERLNQ